jgi:F-box interacting protein
MDQCYDYYFDVKGYGPLGPTVFTRTTVVLELFRGRWHRRDINPPSSRSLVLRSNLSSVRGSWDGVVCIEVRFNDAARYTFLRADQYVLWNPVTLACATVSPPSDAGEIIGAYSHHSTRRFHLVHASGEIVGHHLMAPTTFRILRVGDAVWREIPLLNEETMSMARHHARSVRLHGNLNWLVLRGSESELRLLTFDTTREKFRLMEAPPGRREGQADDVLTRARLGVLSGGKLCTFIVEPSTSTMEVWVLDDYGAVPLRLSNWRLKERISLVLPNSSDLSRQFFMDTDVEVVEGLREGEEIFLHHNHRIVGHGSRRIDAYNLGCKKWHMVNVSRSARTLMYRESILQQEVSFGGASRALSPMVWKGHIRYTLK